MVLGLIRRNFPFSWLYAILSTEYRNIVVSKKAIVSVSIVLAEDTDLYISSSGKCNMTSFGDTDLVQGLRESFLEEITFNPKYGRKGGEGRR